jgi:hypothetical protein
MKSKKINNKILSNRLISLFLAQVVMLSFSVYWIVKYYHHTLISNLDLYHIFSALGSIGKISFAVSLIIIGLILYTFFFKKDRNFSVVLLGLLFFQSTVFFILERLYEIFFTYITILIVAATYAWINFFLLTCVSGIGLILSLLILIQMSLRQEVLSAEKWK